MTALDPDPRYVPEGPLVPRRRPPPIRDRVDLLIGLLLLVIISCAVVVAILAVILLAFAVVHLWQLLR